MESGDFYSLLGLISNAFFCRDEADSWIWKSNTSGDFISKSFYRELGLCDMMPTPCALAWKGPAPPRVEAFCYLQGMI